jgi:hypothetical protein
MRYRKTRLRRIPITTLGAELIDRQRRMVERRIKQANY